MGKREYYLGLDIGTDSVGYAVTGTDYTLLKYRQEPMWGVTTFDAGSSAEKRRAARTMRRNLDRKKQRVYLVSELFAEEIGKIDPNFFIRRQESALYGEDTAHGVKIFDGGITDAEYHAQYPTIHHLICDLMTADTARDVRLVYLACAWLAAHRGHFLLEAAPDAVGELLDFRVPYERLCTYLKDLEFSLPWAESTPPETIQDILQMKTGVGRKQEAFKVRVYGGKAPAKLGTEDFPFSRAAVVSLLCGGTVKPKDLFGKEEYKELDSISLKADEDQFAQNAAELGEDGELLLLLRELYNCALLIESQNGKSCISEAKVEVYNQHKRDLEYLKAFLRKYKPKEFRKVFREITDGNYTAYTYHLTPAQKNTSIEKANKEKFSDYLRKVVKNIPVEPEDAAAYQDMLNRLGAQTFLPKQKDTDNRVIPMQLYRYELAEILRRAEGYLPFLRQLDAEGRTVSEKLLAVFDFRIPYFVGPLNRSSQNAWFERKEPGKIYPWNFDEKVDLDASEQEFIRRMTNTCTYLPGRAVLPEKSLLYEEFTVLNALNNLKLNGSSIPVKVKQQIYTELFLKNSRQVTLSGIRKFLQQQGLLSPGDEVTGLDDAYRGKLKSYHIFYKLLRCQVLTDGEAEEIIQHAAYSEDKVRMGKWLSQRFPQMSEEDRRYLLRQNFKGFGRLSREFLAELSGVRKDTGEVLTIRDALWATNENLMQLLSQRYTFRETLEQLQRDAYDRNPRTLSQKLEDMYVPNGARRPVVRTMDIVGDVVKAMGCAPAKIFVEMARGASEEQRGKRTQTRKQQLLELYKKVKTAEARQLEAELNAMGEMADNRLQSDKLFLYYLQMGKCMYTGQPIELEGLFSRQYDIDHIYPRAHVKDDSVLNNKVLVLSTVNGKKDNVYPLDSGIRSRMRSFWEMLKKNGFVTQEKFTRLVRSTPFTEEERMQFINRQLVETRQACKAVTQLLQERFADTKIVFVKAGLVSEFRQEFDMLKCRSVNDLHHAKDAYLNIVVGNVYHEKFTSRWFDVHREYSIKTKPLFTNEQRIPGELLWRGSEDIAKVRKNMGRNAIHVTRYAFCRGGELFDLLPLKAAEGLIPRKKELPAEKYGGYRKPTAAFFLLTRFCVKKKREVMILPVTIMEAERIRNPQTAEACAVEIAEGILGTKVTKMEFPLGLRPIKVNTVFSVDGLRMTLNGKTSGGKAVLFSVQTQLCLDYAKEKYVKRLEAFCEKRNQNAAIVADKIHDHITAEENIQLYRELSERMNRKPFMKMPANQGKVLMNGLGKFHAAGVYEQAECLLQILQLYNHSSAGCSLKTIGGAENAGNTKLSSNLSNWKKAYTDIRIIDQSASGLSEHCSQNLLELL